MLSEKKIRLAKTFFVITIGTVFVLIYLFMFNQGFHVSDALFSEQGLAINVQNKSVHLIRDIKVYYKDSAGQKILIEEIALLSPDEAAVVRLQQDYAVGNRIYLEAEAPYHPTVLKEVVLSGPGTVPSLKLQPTISVPRSVLAGQPALVTFTVCNEGSSDVDDIELKVRTDPDYFDVDSSSEVFDLAAGDCAVKDFFITGKQSGASTIYFNIIALSLSEEYSANVTITGE